MTNENNNVSNQLTKLDIRQRELSKFEVAVEVKKSEINGLLDKLSQREKHVNERDVKSKEREQTLSDREAELIDRERQVGVKEKAVKMAFKTFDSEKERFVSESHEFESNLNEIDKKRVSLNKQQDLITQTVSKFNKKETALVRREEELEVSEMKVKVMQRDARRVLQRNELK